jgi:hypothetical protein
MHILLSVSGGHLHIVPLRSLGREPDLPVPAEVLAVCPDDLTWTVKQDGFEFVQQASFYPSFDDVTSVFSVLIDLAHDDPNVMIRMLCFWLACFFLVFGFPYVLLEHRFVLGREGNWTELHREIRTLGILLWRSKVDFLEAGDVPDVIDTLRVIGRKRSMCL